MSNCGARRNAFEIFCKGHATNVAKTSVLLPGEMLQLKSSWRRNQLHPSCLRTLDQAVKLINRGHLLREEQERD